MTDLEKKLIDMIIKLSEEHGEPIVTNELMGLIQEVRFERIPAEIVNEARALLARSKERIAETTSERHELRRRFGHEAFDEAEWLAKRGS